VRGSLVFGLIVTSMADIAKIAERVGLMPAGPIRIHGVLPLHFMAILAGRCLRTTLCANRRSRCKKYANCNDDNHTSSYKEKGNIFMFHIIVSERSLDMCNAFNQLPICDAADCLAECFNKKDVTYIFRIAIYIAHSL
jgi:hypothetical protein